MDDNIPPVYPDGIPPVENVEVGSNPKPPRLPPAPAPAPAPTPRPPKRGRGWMVLSLVLFAILGIVLAMNALGFARTLRIKSMPTQRGSHEFLEVMVEDNSSRHKVLLLDIEGIISGAVIDGRGHNLVSWIKDQLDQATEDRAVKAVLLRVDSPGGEIMAADEIYRAIVDFQEKSGKPVVAYLDGMAASGGYYVSAPCQWLVANELTITGSIGVIMHSWNYRGLMNKVGVRPEVFKSGRFKDMLSSEKGDEDMTPEEKDMERQMVQSLVDQSFARFKKVIAEGRAQAVRDNQGKGRSLAKDWVDYADGRILSGQQAYDHGFIDELGTVETAFKRTRKLANIVDANLIRYQQPFRLSNLLDLFAQSNAKSVKIELGIDIPKLQAGRLYLLSPAFMH
jgi:protease-4